MARVTIEDCLKRIDNAYDIVSLASQRAKDILDGSEPKIDYPGKPSVVALKEIAEGLIDMSYFETRRKQKIEEQLSDAIAEEEQYRTLLLNHNNYLKLNHLNLKGNQMKMVLKQLNLSHCRKKIQKTNPPKNLILDIWL